MSTKPFSHTTVSCVAIASALLISLGCCGGRTATHRYCCHTGKWIPRHPTCCSAGPAVAKNSTYFDGCDSGGSGEDQIELSNVDSHRNPKAMIASTATQPSILNQPKSEDSSQNANGPLTTVPEQIAAESIVQTVPAVPVETIQAAPVQFDPVPPPVVEIADKALPQTPIEFEIELIEKSATPSNQVAENQIAEEQITLDEATPPEYLVAEERAYGNEDDAWKTEQTDDSSVAESIVDDFNGRIVLRAKVVQPLIRPLPEDTRLTEGRRLTPAKPVGYPQPTPINVSEPYGGHSLRNVAPAPLQQGVQPTNLPRPMLQPASTSSQPWEGFQPFSGLMANPQSSEVNFSREIPANSVQQTAQPTGNHVKR